MEVNIKIKKSKLKIEITNIKITDKEEEISTYFNEAREIRLKRNNSNKQEEKVWEDLEIPKKTEENKGG